MEKNTAHKDGRRLLLEYDAGYISPFHEMNKKIITEMKDSNFNDDPIFYAVLQKYGVPNKNGRIYPESVLKREDKKYQINIKKGTALNELNHPSSSILDLDRISHSILETWWEGHILMGKIKLFLSPGWKKYGIISCKGDQAAMILMNGGTLGVSSRGVGSLSSIKGQNIVQDDYELICFDIVSSPSTPGAYIFRDPSEREKYEEQITNQPIEADNKTDKMKALMGRLDTFLGKN